MRKIIFILLLTIGFTIPNIKGMDPLCVKDHGSVLLKDKQWHTLKYASPFNGAYHVAEIVIRQKDSDVDYEFKASAKPAMLEFYSWLTLGCGIGGEDDSGIEMGKNGNDGYVGTFASGWFVPGLDDNELFLGIDVFK